MDGWLTVREAAEKLNVHPNTVRGWCRKATIRCRKFGSVWRIARDEVEAITGEHDRIDPDKLQ